MPTRTDLVVAEALAPLDRPAEEGDLRAQARAEDGADVPVGDVHQLAVDETPSPRMYVSADQIFRVKTNLVVRTQADPRGHDQANRGRGARRRSTADDHLGVHAR